LGGKRKRAGESGGADAVQTTGFFMVGGREERKGEKKIKNGDARKAETRGK